MLPELIIVFTLASPEARPALADELFVGPVFDGQYYLHVEAARASMHSDHPDKIDRVSQDPEKMDEGLAVFEVQVNFEAQSVALARKEIGLYSGYLSDGNNASYGNDRQWIGSKTGEEVFDFYEADGGTLVPIAATQDSASWLEVSRYRPHGYTDMWIVYKQIDGERVLEISGNVTSDEITADELKGKVDELIEQFKDLPIRRYTGSVVE